MFSQKASLFSFVMSTALVLPLTACDQVVLLMAQMAEKEEVAAPPIGEPVPMTEVLKQEEKKKTPEERDAARRKAIRLQFTDQMRLAMDDMDWSIMSDEEIASMAPLSYAPAIQGEEWQYSFYSQKKYSNDTIGSIHTTNTALFSLIGDKGGKSKLRGELMLQSLRDHKRRLYGYLGFDFPAKALETNDEGGAKVLASGASPIFQRNIVKVINQYEKASPAMKKKMENPVMASIFDFLPALPQESAIGSTATWAYNPVYSATRPSSKRPAGQVKLVNWLKIGGEPVAWLKVTWPEDDEKWNVEEGLMALYVVGVAGSKTKERGCTLRQRGDIEAHFLVTATGKVIFGHLVGEAALSRESATANKKMMRTRVGTYLDKRVITENEDVYFDMMVKFIGTRTKEKSDELVTLMKPRTRSAATEEEVTALAEQFVSNFDLERFDDAAKLFAPEIRYYFSERTISAMLAGLSESKKAGAFGKPTGILSHAENVFTGDLSQDDVGIVYEGVPASTTKRPMDIVFKAARFNGRPFLSFIGMRSTTGVKEWDILKLGGDMEMTYGPAN